MSDDGACSVLIGVNNPEGRDLSTFSQLSSEANYLERECVERRRAAGIIGGLGNYQSTRLQVSRTFLTVVCDDRPAPPYTTCRSVLDTMPLDQVDRSFGPGGQHPLSFSISSLDGRCEFRTTTAGRTASTSRWDQIRTVMSQIDEMCIKNGISGRAYRIGSAAELIVSSMPRQAVAAS